VPADQVASRLLTRTAKLNGDSFSNSIAIPWVIGLSFPMPRIIESPARIQAHGEPPKTIEEFIGHVSSKTEAISIARMVSPAGWSEPGQTPEFDEYTVVLSGRLQVESRDGIRQIDAGQAIVVTRGEWVRYSTPAPEGAEYIAVCLPAFSLMKVHRDSHDDGPTAVKGADATAASRDDM